MVGEERARILSSRTTALIITCIDGFPALSIKLEDFACVFLGQTKARAMGDSSRKKIDGKYKEIRGNNQVYTQDITWEIAATKLLSRTRPTP